MPFRVPAADEVLQGAKARSQSCSSSLQSSPCAPLIRTVVVFGKISQVVVTAVLCRDRPAGPHSGVGFMSNLIFWKNTNLIYVPGCKLTKTNHLN